MVDSKAERYKYVGGNSRSVYDPLCHVRGTFSIQVLDIKMINILYYIIIFYDEIFV
jgi:hypothetical protein